MASKTTPYTLGADPEFFVNDEKGNPTVACGVFGGTKGKPVPIPGLEGIAGYGLQEDNVMLEFNIPPAKDASTFSDTVYTAVGYLVRLLQSKKMGASRSCAQLFPVDKLSHPKAQEFGCSVDFNAYRDGSPWVKLDPAELKHQVGKKNYEYRFSGGHLHMGGYNKDIPAFVMANFCDWFIALRMMARGYDCGQGVRRKFYGQPGRYRPTPYGIEYRTLSNFWIWDPGLAYEVANCAFACMAATDKFSVAELQKFYQDIPWPAVNDAIMTNSSTRAQEIVRAHTHVFPIE